MIAVNRYTITNVIMSVNGNTKNLAAIASTLNSSFTGLMAPNTTSKQNIRPLLKSERSSIFVPKISIRYTTNHIIAYKRKTK